METLKPIYPEPRAAYFDGEPRDDVVYLGTYAAPEQPRQTVVADLWAMPETDNRVFFWARIGEKISDIRATGRAQFDRDTHQWDVGPQAPEIGLAAARWFANHHYQRLVRCQRTIG